MADKEQDVMRMEAQGEPITKQDNSPEKFSELTKRLEEAEQLAIRNAAFRERIAVEKVKSVLDECDCALVVVDAAGNLIGAGAKCIAKEKLEPVGTGGTKEPWPWDQQSRRKQ